MGYSVCKPTKLQYWVIDIGTFVVMNSWFLDAWNLISGFAWVPLSDWWFLLAVFVDIEYSILTKKSTKGSNAGGVEDERRRSRIVFADQVELVQYSHWVLYTLPASFVRRDLPFSPLCVKLPVDRFPRNFKSLEHVKILNLLVTQRQRSTKDN